MSSLINLLDSIQTCSACRLMEENRAARIPYVPILPKPEARFMFIGRDPSPRTAAVVGIAGGKSSFINEVFRIIGKAGVPEDAMYITDLCKCHWRTSKGKPLPGTEHRPPKLDISIARTCLNTWLTLEIKILQPELVIAFGEELYQILRPFITNPHPSPKKFSAKADKSILDAEYWFVNNGPLTLSVGGRTLRSAFLRHAGNSSTLPRSTDTDKRRRFYEASVKRVIKLLQEGRS